MTASAPRAAEPTFEVELPPAPYPGLRPFNSGEWPVFFGREQMTDEVVRRVIRQHLVVVHGDSGSGKSSLVRAGVLAQLEHERARSGVRWRTGHMLPREAPLQNLATALAGLQGEEAGADAAHEIRRVLNFGTDAAPALAALLRRDDDDDNVCILLDQFEELFDFAAKDGREEAQLLVDFLVGLQEQPPRGLYAILTMRSEFLGACARFKGLAEAVNATQYLLPQMSRPALIRAIREPATLYDGEVSREFAERLIEDAGGGQDQLPLIQHGLMLLWRSKVGGLAERRGRFGLAEAPSIYRERGAPGWRLDSADYQSSGGLAALLSGHADEVMAAAVRDPRSGAADPGREKVVEHLFRALTDINPDRHAIRRPQSVARLRAMTSAEPATLEAIMREFRADGVSFLSPYGEVPLEPEQQVDISHEALIRSWRRIADPEHGWLRQEFRDGLIWQTLLVRAGKNDILSAAATADRARWLATLPSRAWAERYGGGWSQVEDLIERSDKLAKAGEEERRRESEDKIRRAEEIAATQERLREEQRQRAEDAIASRQRQTRWTVLALVTAVIAIVAAGYAWRQSEFADQAALEARVAKAQAEAERDGAQRAEAKAEKHRRRAETAVIETEAASYWLRLKLWDDPIKPEGVKLLWDLTREDEEVRVAMVRQLASSRELLQQFGFKPRPIARAVGLRWPDEAREIVARGVADMADGRFDPRTARPFELVSRTRALAALRSWLDPATFAGATRAIASAVEDLAAERDLNDHQLRALAEIVDMFAAHLEPGVIDRARDRLREILNTDEASASSGRRGQAIGRVIEVMAPVLLPDERSRAVQLLVGQLGQDTESWSANAAPRALAALLPQLDPGQFEAALQDVPAAIAKVAAYDDDGSYLLTLTQITEKLASLRDPTAIAVLGKALAGQFGLPNQPVQRAALARAAIPLLFRLTEGARLIEAQLADITLVPDRATLDPAHRSLLRQRPLERANAAWSAAFAPAAGGDPEPALRILHEEWAAQRPAAASPYRRAAQARLVAALAGALNPQSSLIPLVAQDLLEMVPDAGDYLVRAAIARALAALAPKLADAERERALAAAQDALAGTGSSEEADAWAGAITRLLPDEPRAATTEIVEVLKYPTATGTATDLLLDALKERWSEAATVFGDRPLADQDVLEWLQAHVTPGYSVSEPPAMRSPTDVPTGGLL